jgi:pantoate--beta-alanine ligase
MIVTDDIEQVRGVRAGWGLASVGFVPTMGYLHEGHLSLVRRAKSETSFVAVSIYVNPAQFAPTEDLSRYPRDLERDLALLAAESVDLVFTPSDAVMYPPGFQTYVHVGAVAEGLEGARRPGHFQGVATIVAKLFNIVQPTHVYFGQKDAQQAAVLRRMVADLNFNLRFIVCPTVREPDGLAMSSRNKYLDDANRAGSTALYRALSAAREMWEAGEYDPDRLREAMSRVLAAEPLARVDYVSAADPVTLRELDGGAPAPSALLSMAVYFGTTRLIDNILLEGSEAG